MAYFSYHRMALLASKGISEGASELQWPNRKLLNCRVLESISKAIVTENDCPTVATIKHSNIAQQSSA